MLCIILIHWKPGGNRFLTAWWAQLKSHLSHESWDCICLYLPVSDTAAELLEFLHPISPWTLSWSLSTFFFLETLSKEIPFQVFCSSEEAVWARESTNPFGEDVAADQTSSQRKGLCNVVQITFVKEIFLCSLFQQRGGCWRERMCFGTGTGKLWCLLASMWHLLV